MDTVLALLQQYGTLVYLLLFGYCALKSGWLPLFAGYAAQAGALDVMWVAAASFAGGYVGDEVRFAVARRYGVGWLQGDSPRRRFLARLFRRASALADRYGTAYIFLYRYPKGLRTIGALPIGLTPMPWPKFTVLNAASALLWTVILVGGGYSFGATFDAFGAEKLTALSVLALLVFLLVLVRIWRSASEDEGPDGPAPSAEALR